MTGWVPKNALCRPVPLCCRNEQLDNILKLIIHGAVKSTEARICSLGPRYDTTYFAWKNMSFEFPYGHLSAPKKNPIVLLSGNLPKHIHNHLKDFDYYDTLQFDSNFESGNLDCCIKVCFNLYRLVYINMSCLCGLMLTHVDTYNGTTSE